MSEDGIGFISQYTISPAGTVGPTRRTTLSEEISSSSGLEHRNRDTERTPLCFQWKHGCERGRAAVLLTELSIENLCPEASLATPRFSDGFPRGGTSSVSGAS